MQLFFKNRTNIDIYEICKLRANDRLEIGFVYFDGSVRNEGTQG